MKRLVVISVVVSLFPCHVDAQAPKVEEIIPRATDYVHQFIGKFSNVVAEERYGKFRRFEVKTEESIPR